MPCQRMRGHFLQENAKTTIQRTVLTPGRFIEEAKPSTRRLGGKQMSEYSKETLPDSGLPEDLTSKFGPVLA